MTRETVARGTTTVDHEEWRAVPSAPGYQVSDRGRVMSPSGKLIGTASRHQRGYRRVSIAGHRHVFVHQLVAEAFLGPAEGRRVMLRDTSDPTDARLENLRYGL